MYIKDYKQIERLYINVDMVNGFLNCGAMHDKGISHIIGAQVKILNSLQPNEALWFVVEAHKEYATEFKKFPKHCVEGTNEAQVVDELQKYIRRANIYKKNSTSAIFAKNFLQDLDKCTNLFEVVVMGCCTDICVLNLVLPLVNYFDENNREVVVTVPKNAVETYDAPNHPRNEYNEMAFKLMNQAGVKLVEEYIKE